MKTLCISLVTALGLSLLAVLGVAAQGPVNITVTQVDQSRFPQIDVFVSVTDANGNPVRNLSPNAFRVEQNGKPVNLSAMTRSGEQGAVSTVLVVDHSGSMATGGKMAGAKEAAATFVNQMRPGDKTALVQFDTEIETLQPLTEDKAALAAAIQKLVPRGNTALYDAVAQAAKYLEGASGRRAIILVTDGMDNASKAKRENVLAQVSAGSYSIYTIGLGRPGASPGSQEGIDEGILRELANTSMGTYYYAPEASELVALYQQLSFLIQNEYKLSYISPDPLRDGLKRSIVVTAPGATTTQATYNPGGLIPEAATDLSSWVLFLLALALLVVLFFVPMGVRMGAQWVTARQASSTGPSGAPPSRPRPSRIKLTGPAPTPAATSTPPASTSTAATPARPVRIKLGKKTAAAPERKQMPWEEEPHV